MLLKPLKREVVPSSPTSELVEPSTGAATAFIRKLNEFPKNEKGEVDAHYFSGLRVLICLHENGSSFLPQLINSLNDTNPETWDLRVLEGEAVRSTLDALDPAYLARVVDYFLDNLPATQMEELVVIIRTIIWPDRPDAKN